MKRYIDAMENRKREIENEVDSKNPFDAGVMRAIKSAKASFGLDTDQEHRAIRKGLHMFSDALTKQYGDPRFRERDGTLGKVASLGPAISAGLEGYEAAGEKIEHDNREVYEFAKKLRDEEIKRLREQDKDAFDAYFKDKQLGLEYEKLLEQERYHQGLLEKEKKKLINGDLTPQLSSSKNFIPLTNEHMKDRIAKKYNTSVDLLDEVNSLQASYQVLEKMLDDRGIKNHPLFLNRLVNNKHDWVSTLFSDDEDKALLAQVGVVNAACQRLAMHYEAEDRKRGVTDFMVKYANDNSMYPTMQRPTSFKAQLNELKKNVELSVFTTEESLKNGYDINKKNYKDYLKLYNSHKKQMENSLNDRDNIIQPIQQLPNRNIVESPLNTNITSNIENTPIQHNTGNMNIQPNIGNISNTKNKIHKDDKVLMIDPKTGKKDWIHKDWVQDAIDNDGLQVVYEQF